MIKLSGRMSPLLHINKFIYNIRELLVYNIAIT